MSKVESLVRVPRLKRFILLLSFSDILLVVLILEAAFVVLKGSKVVFTSLCSIGYNFGKMNR